MTKLMRFLKILSFSFGSYFLMSCQQEHAVFLENYPKIDLLITNGQVIDGLGNEAILADIAIVGDEIVFLGKSEFSPDELTNRVKLVIDAKNQTITPGFIDLHSHGDPLATPDFENFLAMGVTTISLGQDGSSPNVPKLSDWLAKVEDQGIGVNLAMFVGHGTLRTVSGIGRNSAPSADALTQLSELLNNTLKYTFGMSTGLEYNPGLNADEDELLILADVVGINNRILMSHMRNEDNTALAESIRELVNQGRFTKVHVSHIKSVYGHGVADAEEILDILAEARKNGIQISADIYPYNASYAGLALLFPVWAKTPEQFEDAMINRKDELELYLKNKIEKRNGPSATLIGTAPYTGKTLAELSEQFKLTPEQVLLKLGPSGYSGAYFIMDDELQSRLLIDPNISISSDGSYTGFHPRGHGTFAKIIERFVQQRKVLTLTEAVRKMTSQSAKILGINDRGEIKVGNKADILIFDPEKVKAKATYPEPHQLAEGFDVVIINGKIARRDGKISPKFSGLVLKPNSIK